MNTFTGKLRKSGDSNQQIVEIVVSGVVGYNRRKERIGNVQREGWGTVR